jgi:IS5 family transposase
LAGAGLVEKLFERFDKHLRGKGFAARKGQIVDASIMPVPVQRNTREENKEIKAGETPEEWEDKPAKRHQKDTGARWTKKNGISHYGYKNHVIVDVEHKLIRMYEVTDASVHDGHVLEKLLDKTNTSRDVWADSAYRSEESVDKLKEDGWREHLQRKGCRGRKLTKREKQGNKTRAKTRSRVEHVFGVQARRAGGKLIRAVGRVRVAAKIGLRNLAYNIDRHAMLQTARG